VAGAAKLRIRRAFDKQEAIQAANEESMYLVRNAQILRCAQDDTLEREF
jgi:hypothetical protein